MMSSVLYLFLALVTLSALLDDPRVIVPVLAGDEAALVDPQIKILGGSPPDDDVIRREDLRRFVVKDLYSHRPGVLDGDLAIVPHPATRDLIREDQPNVRGDCVLLLGHAA